MSKFLARKKKGGGSDKDPIVGINVTPLVDVCLVLVIIFMVTAPILSDPAFKVRIPQTALQEEGQGDKVAVSLSPDGRLAVEDKEVEGLDAFALELQSRLDRSRDKQVVFKADRDAEHGALIELMQTAKAVGARTMTIATEKQAAP